MIDVWNWIWTEGAMWYGRFWIICGIIWLVRVLLQGDTDR